MEWFSPAKINLTLRVLGRRSDGYHELSSLFQAVSLGDTLAVSSHPRDLLTCTDASLPVDESNLILKALRLFKEKTGLKETFHIHLTKRIPMEAGLGGGSSNAATTLWWTNHLLKGGVDEETLQTWGAELGSDVPFFFSHGRALCEGRGERVQEEVFEEGSVWIVKPPIGLSTKEVFRHWRKEESHSSNDLEKTALALAPSLAELKALLLSEGFHTVGLSGSGTAFFCLGEGRLPLLPTGYFQERACFIERRPGEWYRNGTLLSDVVKAL